MMACAPGDIEVSLLVVYELDCDSVEHAGARALHSQSADTFTTAQPVRANLHMQPSKIFRVI